MYYSSMYYMNAPNKPPDFSDLSKITTYQSGVIQSAAFRALKKYTDDCLREHGITTMQWFIIGTLLDAGPKGMRITDLSYKVDTTLSFLTNTVNLLESKNMLVRLEHASDSRARMVTVSKVFRPKCKVIERDLRNKLRKTLYANISPEELRTYIKVLYELSNLS
jgi:DNA-binding MarR family transcriptional regulator